MWNSAGWTRISDLARWHVTTQFGARRNAFLACAELAERRRVHDEVEEIRKRISTPAVLPRSPERRQPPDYDSLAGRVQ